MSSSQRNQSLDVLRAIAVFLTLARHFPAYTTLHRAGWIGVDLFFVLSGYLISGLLFREFQATGGIKIWRFILRRGFKIWPAFYALTIGTVLFLWLGGQSIPWTGVAANACFLQNYFYLERFFRLFMYHTWSLGVEEHFYIALPLLLAGLIAMSKAKPTKNPFRSIPGIFLVLCIGCALLRWLTLEPPFNPTTPTHLRIDALFAGVTLGYLYQFRPNVFRKISKGWYAPLVAICCCLPAFVFEADTRWFQSFGLTLLLIGFSFLVSWAAPREPSALLGRRIAAALAAVGGYSYSIYLWHLLLAHLFLVSAPSSGRFWTYVAGSIVFGILMSELIEKPALRFRNKWIREPASVGAIGLRQERSALPPGNPAPDLA